MQDSLKHAVWNSVQEFERVFSIWERAYIKFVIDILREIMEAEARLAGNGNSQRTTTSPAAIGEAPAARSMKQASQGGNQNTHLRLGRDHLLRVARLRDDPMVRPLRRCQAGGVFNLREVKLITLLQRPWELGMVQ